MRSVRFLVVTVAVLFACWGASSASQVIELERWESENWEEVLELPPAPEGKNAWDRLLALGQSLPEMIDGEIEVRLELMNHMGPLSPDELAEAEMLLERYMDFASRVALDEGEFLAAPVASSISEPGPDFESVRDLVRVKSWLITVAWLNCNYREAFGDACSLLEIGRSICLNPTNLVSYLNGIAIMGTATDRLYWMLAQPGLSVEAIEMNMSRLLSAGDGHTEGYVNALRAEFKYTFLPAIDELSAQEDALSAVTDSLALDTEDRMAEVVASLSEVVEDSLYDRRATVAAYGSALAALIRKIETNEPIDARQFRTDFARRISMWGGDLDGFAAMAERAASVESVEEQASIMTTTLERYPNSIGRVVLSVSVPNNLDQVTDTYLANVAIVRLLSLLARMRVAVILNQELPDRIEDLFPTAHPVSAMVDPFDGHPLRYDKDRKAVWSLGRNRIDDGGKEHEQHHGLGKDFVFRLRD